MKTLLTTTAFIALTFLFACKDDTKQLLKNLDGRWTVSNVTFTNQAGKDSVVTTTATALEFDACSKSANGSGPNNCLVYYSQGNQRYNFTYQATDGNKSLSINPTGMANPALYQQISTVVSGSYSVVSLTDNTLVIRKKEICQQRAGGEICSYVTLSATR